MICDIIGSAHAIQVILIATKADLATDRPWFLLGWLIGLVISVAVWIYIDFVKHP